MEGELLNELSKFSSYNSLWTLACVPLKQIANASSYRKEQLKHIVMSSAGRYDAQRVKTAHGVPEYFIDNIEMDSLMTSTVGNGNIKNLKIDFEIFEPYSLGLFLQSLQVAALEAGYRSYLDNAAFVMKLEFKGQLAPGKFETVGPYFFLCKLTAVDFKVTESGSKYQVKTIAYDQQLVMSSVNAAFNDVKLIGKTAKEALVTHPTNSLIAQLHEREEQMKRDKKKTIKDEYSIEFVPPDWGGVNPFELETSGNLEFDADSTGGIEVFKRQSEVAGADGKAEREKITINPKEKTFMFSQGTSLTNIVDSIILMTKEIRDNATDPSKMKDGFVTWWRVSMDIELDKYDEKTREYSKKVKIRIIPYKTHHSVYMGPEATSQGIEPLKKKLPKRYHYIYTGKNTEVLTFNIDIKTQFFTAANPNPADSTANTNNPGTNASVQPTVYTAVASEGVNGSTKLETAMGANQAAPMKYSLHAGNEPFKGGSGRQDTKQKVANEFYINALTKSVDMVNLEIEIMGDPFWLPENGFGNYHPKGNGTMIADGTVNHESQDVFVHVTFKNPVDVINARGLLEFQYGITESPFSGVYRVTEIKHRWSNGLYKITLKGYRLPAQEGGKGGDVFPVKLGGLATKFDSVIKWAGSFLNGG